MTTETRTVRVAVVDDQAMVRDGFAMMISAQPDMEVAVSVEDGQQFLDAVRRDPRIDVALVDIRMPVLDGLQATRALAAVPHAPAVVVVTTFDDDTYVLDAIAAGARGFLLKRCSGRELVRAVRTVACRWLDPVHRGDRSGPVPGAGRRADLRHRPGRLPAHRSRARRPRLVGAGLNNTEISERLHLSMSTVKTHVTNVLAKTGSRDRVQAAILAIRSGITPS